MVLAEVELGDVSQLEGEVGRDVGEEVVREVDTDHLPTELLYLLTPKHITITTLPARLYLHRDVRQLHHGEVQLPVLQLVLQTVLGGHRSNLTL